MMALVSSSMLAFSPAAPVLSSQTGAASAVSMSLARRSVVGTAAAALVAAPLGAFADGASSPAVRERARAIYGSRVYRLQGASVEKIIEEKNAFQLFTTGAYRSDSASKAGAPTTDTVEAQMGSMKYAFYQAVPDKK